jgi:hypothetical protein
LGTPNPFFETMSKYKVIVSLLELPSCILLQKKRISSLDISIYPYGGNVKTNDAFSSLDIVVRESSRFDFYTVIMKSNGDLAEINIYSVYADSDSGFTKIYCKQ